MDISNLRNNGFVHWNDDFTAERLEHLSGLTYFWGLKGMDILHSILANGRLRSVLLGAFGPGPHMIRHCLWWSQTPTLGQPIYIKKKHDQIDKCLGLHILPRETRVCYFTGSHMADGSDGNNPPCTNTSDTTNRLKNFEYHQPGPWFIDTQPELQCYRKSEPLSNGL